MQESKDKSDIVILGAGPAGLTAAQYGARANLRVTVIEERSPGGQALCIDTLENYPGLAPQSGFETAQNMYRQAERFGAAFITETAESLKKEGSLFVITLGSGNTITALAVIAATGARHRKLGVPGEEEFAGLGVSYCASCDGPFFKGKKIFVVGGGDGACGEAQFLSRLASEAVLIHRRDRFRAQKALAERVFQNPLIEVRFNTRLREIRGGHKVDSLILENTETNRVYEEAGDGVFICAGITPQTALVPDLPKDENGYILTDQAMATAVPGLFAAGDVRACPFRQVIVAAGEGAVAAHSAVEYIGRIASR